MIKRACILGSILALGLTAAELPDPKLTPGATVPVSHAKLCAEGYAASVRHVPGSVKAKAYAEYGIKSHKTGSYEIDHLVSLELGGSNDLKNLWPQSYSGEWNAHVKDALEDRLRALVCAASPSMTLAEAQRAIRGDWIASYKRVFKTSKQLP
jgi:hypothetical protein